MADTGKSMDSALDHPAEMVQCTPNIESLHLNCFACGNSENGLRLKFTAEEDISVTAEWLCQECYQSYDGIIHGGIIATLLDAAMTNCLLAQGIEAMTADLQVRYRASIKPGKKVRISASLVEKQRSIYTLESQVEQDGSVAAIAKARFMKRERGKGRNV